MAISRGLVARMIQRYRSPPGPKGEDLVEEARALDESRTDADKQAFKNLMDKQRR
jgi:hypothetical protein